MSSIVYFCSCERQSGQMIPNHAHAYWELVYYTDAAGKTQIGQKSFHYGKNTYAIIPPQAVHSERHDKTGRLMFIGFLFPEKELPVGLFQDDEFQSVRHTVESILWEQKKRYADSDSRVELLLQELVLLAQRAEHPESEQTDDLSYAKHFIEENYSWKINFRELAESCGYRFDSFRHKFKADYGISPRAYLVECRLEKARELLRESNLNCTQIAYECGFSDSSQFSTMYRKKFGTSPGRGGKSSKG